jgi:hypothetical protein
MVHLEYGNGKADALMVEGDFNDPEVKCMFWDHVRTVALTNGAAAIFFASEAWAGALTKEEAEEFYRANQKVSDMPSKKEVLVVQAEVCGAVYLATWDIDRRTNSLVMSKESEQAFLRPTTLEGRMANLMPYNYVEALMKEQGTKVMP